MIVCNESATTTGNVSLIVTGNNGTDTIMGDTTNLSSGVYNYSVTVATGYTAGKPVFVLFLLNLPPGREIAGNFSLALSVKPKLLININVFQSSKSKPASP